jgi:hypothetical protein
VLRARPKGSQLKSGLGKEMTKRSLLQARVFWWFWCGWAGDSGLGEVLDIDMLYGEFVDREGAAALADVLSGETADAPSQKTPWVLGDWVQVSYLLGFASLLV